MTAKEPDPRFSPLADFKNQTLLPSAFPLFERGEPNPGSSLIPDPLPLQLIPEQKNYPPKVKVFF